MIGTILILKNKVIGNLPLIIYLLITVLVIFYIVEICSFRWHQLTEKEKNKLTTIVELKKNLSKTFEAINLGFRKILEFLNSLHFERNNENINKKKWVRNDNNDNIKA